MASTTIYSSVPCAPQLIADQSTQNFRAREPTARRAIKGPIGRKTEQEHNLFTQPVQTKRRRTERPVTDKSSVRRIRSKLLPLIIATEQREAREARGSFDSCAHVNRAIVRRSKLEDFQLEDEGVYAPRATPTADIADVFPPTTSEIDKFELGLIAHDFGARCSSPNSASAVFGRSERSKRKGKVCRLDGCEGSVRARQLCSRHYQSTSRKLRDSIRRARVQNKLS